MSQAPNTQQPSIALPVVALVCVFVCWPIGLVLAIVSLVKYSDAAGSTAKTLAIIALGINLVMLPMVGIMAAIAIPNFVKFQCKSKQSEAKGNLKALYVAEESFRAEFDTYSADLTKIGFTPRGTKIRYTYVVDAASKESFHAVAQVLPQYHAELGTDAWAIDEKNNIVNTLNGCN